MNINSTLNLNYKTFSAIKYIRNRKIKKLAVCTNFKNTIIFMINITDFKEIKESLVQVNN